MAKKKLRENIIRNPEGWPAKKKKKNRVPALIAKVLAGSLKKRT